MKKLLIVLAGFMFFASNPASEAQEVLNGVYVKTHSADRKPIPYQFLREADVMWSKIIWRELDVREKINQPLYYPTLPSLNGRMSLIELLMWGIKNQGLNAYDPSGDDEFSVTLTMKDIEERFGAKEDIQVIENPETGEMEEVIIPGTITSSEVKRYLIKELWFFDKQRSVMEVRIIGICPVREYYKPEDMDQEDVKQAKLFWVYFPEARKIFANHEVFNPQNDAERRTFEDIFFKRHFSSFIVQESNSYNNRMISEYAIGLEAMLEAERVKESIFNFEQDLWEY